MKINIKLFYVLFICLVVFPSIVCAFPSYNFNATYSPIVGATQEYTYNNGGGAAQFINRTLTLGSYNGNLLNLGSITSIDTGSIDITTSSSQGTWLSGTYLANIYSPMQSLLLGTCSVSINYVSNTTPTAAIYDININSIYWNNTVKTYALPSGNPASEQLNISYTADSAMSQYKSSSATNHPISGSAGLIYYQSPGSSYPYISAVLGSYMTNTFTYNFINQINISQTSTGYSYYITKGDGTPQNTGYSIVNITDASGGIPYPSTLNAINISGIFYNVPVFINIQDPQTNYFWNFTAFYPRYNLTAPILNSTVNTPISISLRSSTGLNPSDVNQVVFNTNFPNSNNIPSNILYDNNQTQRNPLNFYKKSGNWYQSDGIGFNINLGSTLPNTFTTTFINTGNYYVTATLNSNLIGGFAANNPLRFYITGTNAGTYAYFTISDSKTGNPISGSILGIFDVPNQKWTNTTLTSGSINLPLNTNYFYAYQGTAPNYQPSAFNTLLIPSGGGNATISIALIPSSLAVTAGNTTISIAVVNGLTNAPVSGATVTVSAANATNYPTQSQTTVNGNTLFVVPTGNTYTASASATGYQSGSLIAVVGSSPVTQTISLTPLSSVPTIATSTTTYPGQQPSIYPTLNGTVTDQTNPFFGNAIDWLGFMGAKPSEIALVLAFLLILLGGVCGSAASSVGLGYAYQPDPLGALAGALLGFIASVAFGFFPAWLAVAAVIIIAFIVARRAWA